MFDYLDKIQKDPNTDVRTLRDINSSSKQISYFKVNLMEPFKIIEYYGHSLYTIINEVIEVN